jgi:hypothetical protein
VRGVWHFVIRLAPGAGLILVSVSLCLLLLEVGVRVLDGVPVFSSVNFVAQALDEVHGGMVQYDPRVGWVVAPNIETPGFTTGEFGVRMSSTTIVPLQQGAILMVGDSFGAGSGVADAKAWPAELERAIGTQVINAAVGGYGLDQLVLRAETLLPRLKPRMLIVQTRLEYGNSVDRMSVAGGAPKPYFTIENSELALHNEPVPKIASRSSDIGWLRSVFGRSYLVQYLMTRLNLLQWWVSSSSMRIKWELSTDEAKEVGCLLMQRLARLRDNYMARLALVVQYSGPEVIERPLHWEKDRSYILSCAEREGLEIVDTLDALRSVYQERDLPSFQRLWQMQDNNRIYGHMSAEGNRLIADLVLKNLFKHGLSEGSQ